MSPKVIPINKTETKCVFVPCPSNLRLINKHAVPDLRLAFTASRCEILLYGVKPYYTEYLLGIAYLFRVVLKIGIILGLVQQCTFGLLYLLPAFSEPPNLLLPNSWNLSKFPWHGFCETANVKCKNELKTSRDGRHLLAIVCYEL